MKRNTQCFLLKWHSVRFLSHHIWEWFLFSTTYTTNISSHLILIYTYPHNSWWYFWWLMHCSHSGYSQNRGEWKQHQGHRLPRLLPVAGVPGPDASQDVCRPWQGQLMPKMGLGCACRGMKGTWCSRWLMHYMNTTGLRFSIASVMTSDFLFVWRSCSTPKFSYARTSLILSSGG